MNKLIRQIIMTITIFMSCVIVFSIGYFIGFLLYE